MKSNFSDISKDTLIIHINDLLDRMGVFKLEIDVSLGKLMYINEDRISVQGRGYYMNQDIKSLKKEDLVVVLRYLQNKDKCREIKSSTIKYGELFDVRKGTFKKVPCNEDNVRLKIQEFLERKKYIAVMDRRK